jgi:hypothetical protein
MPGGLRVVAERTRWRCSVRWMGGFALLLGGCSLLVDASEIDAGCAADEKRCYFECVKRDDPAYGCRPTQCEPCDLANGVPACGADDQCHAEYCLYGFARTRSDGVWKCSVQPVLADPANCGPFGAACLDGELCHAGKCVPANN